MSKKLILPSDKIVRAGRVPSRRDFLKTAGIVAGGLAFSGLLPNTARATDIIPSTAWPIPDDHNGTPTDLPWGHADANGVVKKNYLDVVGVTVDFSGQELSMVEGSLVRQIMPLDNYFYPDDTDPYTLAGHSDYGGMADHNYPWGKGDIDTSIFAIRLAFRPFSHWYDSGTCINLLVPRISEEIPLHSAISDGTAYWSDEVHHYVSGTALSRSKIDSMQPSNMTGPSRSTFTSIGIDSCTYSGLGDDAQWWVVGQSGEYYLDVWGIILACVPDDWSLLPYQTATLHTRAQLNVDVPYCFNY